MVTPTGNPSQSESLPSWFESSLNVWLLTDDDPTPNDVLPPFSLLLVVSSAATAGTLSVELWRRFRIDMISAFFGGRFVAAVSSPVLPLAFAALIVCGRLLHAIQVLARLSMPPLLM